MYLNLIVFNNNLTLKYTIIKGTEDLVLII